MKNVLSVMLIAGCFLAVYAGSASASSANSADTIKKAGIAAKALIPQKTCPVMGGAIDKSIYADYKGKRVYFCCSGCPAMFKKEPEKYLKILADRGESVETIAAVKDTTKATAGKADTAKGSSIKTALIPQKTCPVMGDPIDKKLYVDYQGKRIYVCCEMCKSEVSKNPEKWIKKLNDMGEAVETISRK
jgi:YHS domain-containing protein